MLEKVENHCCKELLEIIQLREVSQTERFRTRNALDAS